MAGGKVSPRQKMINMMYLVLTALLALNVSAEILLSFKTLANSLRSSAEKFDHKNDYLAEIMNKELDKEANKNKAHLKPLIAELQAEKQKTIQYLQEHITSLTKIVGTDKETGDIAKPDELEANYNYWMGKDDAANGGRGAGKAKELRERLNGFVDWANNWYESNSKKYKFTGAANFQKFAPLCLDPKDDPSIKHRETKNKTWEYYTFHGSPVIANIAMMEKYKNDINTIESDLLENVKAEIAEIELKIDSIIAIDAPSSSIVAAGLPFETQLFVAMSSKNIKPTFSGTGTITPEKGGQSAKLKIMANGNVIPAGKMYGEQPYTATIKVPKADGSFMVLNLKKSFKVAKPVIEVTSAALNIMYKDCANQAFIKCPTLGEYYNPQISATEASVSIDPKDKTLVTVVPTGKQTIVTVNTNTNGSILKLGSLTYRVEPPKRPTFTILYEGKKWDGVTPIPMKANLEIRVDPDQDFKEKMPKDARYKISGLKIKIRKSALTSPQQEGGTKDSGVAQNPKITIPLAEYTRATTAGNQMYIEFDAIKRVNFQNKEIEEVFSIRERTVAVTLK